MAKRRIYWSGYDAYRERENANALDDPESSVGGLTEVLGKLQFDFLKSQGMQPHHRMLDIGCGNLRGGIHAIRYLDVGRYTGFDLSAVKIAQARDVVEKEGLTEKKPTLIVNDGPLTFEGLGTFDFLLAQSVFTHLPREEVAKCFTNVRKVMAPDAPFYFTFFEGDYRERRPSVFDYPFEMLVELAQGFRLERPAYAHPRGQIMVLAR